MQHKFVVDVNRLHDIVSINRASLRFTEKEDEPQVDGTWSASRDDNLLETTPDVAGKHGRDEQSCNPETIKRRQLREQYVPVI